MDKQPDSLPKLAETNGKLPYPTFQNAASTDSEEEKWDLGWLSAVARRRALLMAHVAIGTFLVAGGLLLITARLTEPQYEGGFQLLVEPITAEEQQTRSSIQAQGSAVPSTERINIEQSNLDYESQIRILQGPKLLKSVIDQVNPRYPDVTYETFIKSLTIERIKTLTSDKKEKATKLIEVTYQDTDPEKIKFVLERLSQAYLNYSLNERQSTIRRGIQFIDSQLPPLRQRVDMLQRQIQTLRQQYTIVDPEQQGRLLTENAGKLDEARANNQTQLAEAEAKRNTLAQQLQEASPQSVLGETSYYQTLLNQYQQIEGQIAVESARLKPDNPAMQALLEKRRNLQSLLNREAGRVVEKATDSITVVDARRQAINRVQTEMDQKIRQLPAIARQYTDLQRELALATDSLNKFATRQEALQIDAAQQEIPWELTIPPTLKLNESGQLVKVNSISEVRFLALIAVLAILLGVGVGFLLEINQDVLHTPDEVKRATRLPLLGVIPHNDSDQDKVSRLTILGVALPVSSAVRFDDSYSARATETVVPITGDFKLQAVSPAVAESFRSLSKNIRLLSKTYAPIRSLTITSAEVGEGKSTIALHLAKTAATMGQRVLLVDADLRHPQIHELLKLPNQQGLSDLLKNEQDIQSVIQSTPSSANLMVLTAGKPPLDPVELLTTNRVEPLFQQLQAMFDLVIFDTPPLVGLVDSGLVASQTDSLALVVRLGKTSRSSTAAALEELKFSPKAILGVIANDASKLASLTSRYYSLAQKPS